MTTRGWTVTWYDPAGTHVTPNGDLIEHDPTVDCICGPDVEWVNPDTGGTYEHGPLVGHHSLDGREADE